MSWQSYVDEQLLYELPSGNRLTSAVIVGLDGGVWAQSSNFLPLTADEAANIVAAFEDAASISQNGLYIGGTKFMVIQGEPGQVIRGKKGPGGVTIKKTNLCMVFGIYDEPVSPSECNVIVEKLGDYLIEQGY